ncbi:hypothetical protein [Longirhabdus pacifica]|uniref:hypothetical protein n=1 Tax=Longirhabdus pacifica TaxID=2305227 RepID=UPI001008829B|nr:hypothetical protein [Longirhabdus pacifica]
MSHTLNSEDYHIIEQALHTALKYQVEEDTLNKYRQVLSKMDHDTSASTLTNSDNEQHQQHTEEKTNDVQQDGFRYDYDDSNVNLI